MYYRLSGTDPIPCSWREGVEWFETADRIVAKTEPVEGVEVSTVFLGLDHNFSGIGPPLLWETMVFVGDDGDHVDHPDFMRRYATWQEALDGHEAVCIAVRQWAQAQRQALWQAW